MQNLPNIKQGPISVDSLYEMVGAAMNVPTVSMGQPTQFVVLNSIDTLSKASEVIPAPPFTMQALAAVVVCGDLGRATDKEKLILDCESASQQLLLTAHANGLGAYISPIYPYQDRIKGITRLLEMPENVVGHSYVALGYPAKIPSASEAFRNERVHYNCWVRKKSSY